MDKYVISEEEDVLDAEPPFDDFMKSGITIMELRKNTRFGNIINYVDNLFQNDARRVIFRGVGDAAEKCVSCVEVFKRKRQEELYQWNALGTAKRVTYWDPLVEGMNRLKVILDTPVIFIMLSRDPYPSQLQCMSMQLSSSNGIVLPMARRSSPKRRGNQKRQCMPNKWSQPSKNTKEAEAAERSRILWQLEKLA
ncbi:unnamed protein product [Angiostrongylus costaricensis]|uniref:Alba domain-containing protein n=1 Tax=Angiostrongylus costaricensis TaxID=334426 RepID=A0A0R3PX26_ANGCS|nr:unnamed protein product [Angiostrongylus costaricensis]